MSSFLINYLISFDPDWTSRYDQKFFSGSEACRLYRDFFAPCTAPIRRTRNLRMHSEHCKNAGSWGVELSWAPHMSVSGKWRGWLKHFVIGSYMMKNVRTLLPLLKSTSKIFINAISRRRFTRLWPFFECIDLRDAILVFEYLAILSACLTLAFVTSWVEAPSELYWCLININNGSNEICEIHVTLWRQTMKKNKTFDGIENEWLLW